VECLVEEGIIGAISGVGWDFQGDRNGVLAGLAASGRLGRRVRADFMENDVGFDGEGPEGDAGLVDGVRERLESSPGHEFVGDGGGHV